MRFATFLALAGSALAIPLDGNHDGSCVVPTDPTAVIDSGKIIGTATSLPDAPSEVNKFLGIPYAKPPQRFAKPEKPEAWADNLALVTQKYSPSCFQQFNYPNPGRAFTIASFSSPSPVESENCLFLNVFAPAGEAPEGGRPVLFWIYGGGLQFGNAGQPAYDGSYLAGFEDVVVVTINYRTNSTFPMPVLIPLTNTLQSLVSHRPQSSSVRIATWASTTSVSPSTGSSATLPPLVVLQTR